MSRQALFYTILFLISVFLNKCQTSQQYYAEILPGYEVAKFRFHKEFESNQFKVIAKNGAELRKDGLSDSALLATIPYGETVQIIQDRKRGTSLLPYKVSYKGKTGYVSSWNLKRVLSSEGWDDSYLNGDGIKIKSSPDKDSSDLDIVPYSRKITVIEISGRKEKLYDQESEWIKILYNDKAGWISKLFIDKLIPIEKNASGIQVAQAGYKIMESNSGNVFFIEEAEQKCRSIGMRLPSVTELKSSLKSEMFSVRGSGQVKCYWTNEQADDRQDEFKTVCPKFRIDDPQGYKYTDPYESSSDIFTTQEKLLCYSTGKNDFRDIDFLKDKKRIPSEELYVKADNIKSYRFPNKYAGTAQIKSKGDRVFIKALGKKDTVDGVSENWAYLGTEYKSSREIWIFKGDLVGKDPLSAEERSRYELKMMQESYRKGLEECRKLPNCEY